MKTLRLYFIISATFIFSSTFAQNNQNDYTYAREESNESTQEPAQQKSQFLDKLFVGGGLGAGFGNYTYINISPIIGYRVTPK